MFVGKVSSFQDIFSPHKIHGMKKLLLISAFTFLYIILQAQSFNGSYCADVHYYNPNTGKNSEYRSKVVVDNNTLIRVDFPNGWHDQDEFGNQNLKNKGVAIYDVRGSQYIVKLNKVSAANCYDGVPQSQQCRGITKKGYRCTRMTDNRNGYCFQHGG